MSVYVLLFTEWIRDCSFCNRHHGFSSAIYKCEPEYTFENTSAIITIRLVIAHHCYVSVQAQLREVR